MSQTVTITIAAAGTDTGPFNIYSNLDYVTPINTGVLKSELLSGYVSSVVPDAATSVRVKSNNVNCTNYVDMTIIVPVFISLATSATCSDDPCFTAGTTSWPCSGRVKINLTNPPSPYTITISYYNTPSGGSSYANLVYVGGLPYVDLGFDSSGTQLGVTATLKNGSGVTVATSTTQIYAPNSTFNSGLPSCPAPDA